MLHVGCSQCLRDGAGARLHDRPHDRYQRKRQQEPHPQQAPEQDESASSPLASGQRRGSRRFGDRGAHVVLRRCSNLAVSSTSTNEIANSIVATAAASANRNCPVSSKMNTGAVSVFPVRLPDTRMTLPISPRHRLNVSNDPATTAERIAGNTTRRNEVRGAAPSVAAASSS